MLLNFLYPELEEKWIVRHEGTFYRNYSRDVMELDPEHAEVRLSRDSLLSLLPQGLISPDDELKGGDLAEKHQEIELRKRVLLEAFLPFDSLAFNYRLRAERNIAELLDDKLAWLLKSFAGFDLETVENPYVREMVPLLPLIRLHRGNFGLLRNLLAVLFRCEVTMTERRYSETDSTRSWLPSVRYELLVPDLSSEEFRTLHRDLQPLKSFLEEWFVPMEVRLEIVIKQHGITPKVGEPLTLDYTTDL